MFGAMETNLKAQIAEKRFANLPADVKHRPLTYSFFVGEAPRSLCNSFALARGRTRFGHVCSGILFLSAPPRFGCSTDAKINTICFHPSVLLLLLRHVHSCILMMALQPWATPHLPTASFLSKASWVYPFVRVCLLQLP